MKVLGSLPKKACKSSRLTPSRGAVPNVAGLNGRRRRVLLAEKAKQTRVSLASLEQLQVQTRFRARSRTAKAVSSGSYSVDNKEDDSPQTSSSWPLKVGLCILALTLAVWKIPVLNSIAVKSGFTAAFSLVFVSEIGDKTFFLAALLAAQKSRVLVLAGSMLALSLMTVISVSIGYALQQLPSILQSSVPVTEYLSTALIFLFGAQSLRDAFSPDAKDSVEDELEDAKETLELEGVKDKTSWSILLSTFAIIFAAEWGDRSMFATIALVASQNPIGVAVGGTVGHLVATLIAIVGGAMLSKYLSERLIKMVGGFMFLLIGVASLVGVF